VLPISAAKGLEFDAVVVVEPAAVLAESPRGANDLYVALTRATQRLTVVHAQPLPGMLHKLDGAA
jgi:DNA helicase IV